MPGDIQIGDRALVASPWQQHGAASADAERLATEDGVAFDLAATAGAALSLEA